jgi:hypothetical protein
MRTKKAVIIAVITFCLLSVSAWAQPATVRFVSGHGQAFWITNNTYKTLSITLKEIEIQVGSEWKAYSAPTEPGPGLLYFLHRHFLKPDSNEGWLSPHEAAFGSLLAQSISLPKDSVWRAQVIVEEELTGQERIDAAAKYPAATLERWSYLGHPQEILSEEIRP